MNKKTYTCKYCFQTFTEEKFYNGHYSSCLKNPFNETCETCDYCRKECKHKKGFVSVIACPHYVQTTERDNDGKPTTDIEESA